MLVRENFKVHPNNCLLCGDEKRIWLARGKDYEYATTCIEFDFFYKICVEIC